MIVPVFLEPGAIRPHSDVSIISRRLIPWGGYIFTANNTGMRIPFSGRLVAWEFYTEYNGSTALFVLRHTEGDEYVQTILVKVLF